MPSLFRRALLSVASPYIRMELPGWGKLARAGGVLEDDLWKDAPTHIIDGKLHGYRMKLDLRSWSDRQSFYLKRYYDLPGQLLLQAALRPGDRFVDVGANIGMMTLLAAKCVGESGEVQSFEPNPRALERLTEHVRMNNLKQVTIHQAALADQPGTLTLRVVGEHTGAGTLGAIRDADKDAVSMQVDVKVLRGDDLISANQKPTMLKIDVEGFELNVLRGFITLLKENRPFVVTETVPWFLKRAGTDLHEVYAFMQGFGYQPFDFPTARQGLGQKLLILPVEQGKEESIKNVAWIHPESPFAERLKPEGASAPSGSNSSQKSAA